MAKRQGWQISQGKAASDNSGVKNAPVTIYNSEAMQQSLRERKEITVKDQQYPGGQIRPSNS